METHPQFALQQELALESDGDPARDISKLLFRPRHGVPKLFTRELSFAESALERDALEILDLLRLAGVIQDFRSQPYSVRYTFHGCSRRYTPDIRVVFGATKIALEVKPLLVLADPSQMRRLDAAAIAIHARGDRFRIWTDVDIRRRPRASKLKEAYRKVLETSDAREARSLCWELVGKELVSVLCEILWPPSATSAIVRETHGAPRGPKDSRESLEAMVEAMYVAHS
jgi:hypothetical protein